MATKSILKTVHIKHKKSALRLVNALENASGKRSKPIVVSKAHTDASKEEIKRMFGE